MAVRVRVEGLRELDRALSELPRATGKSVLRRTGVKALTPMKDTARRLAPDDPATPDIDLESSISVSSRQKSGRQRQRTREGKASVNVYMGPTKEGYPQAIMQEFGTSHHGPQPYMRPAWDSHKAQALDIIKNEMWGEIEAAAKRVAKRAERLARRAARG